MVGPIEMTFVVIAVMGISVILFSGWVAVIAVKGIARLLGMVLLGGVGMLRRSGGGGAVCRRCARANPSQARYCRRCGSPL